MDGWVYGKKNPLFIRRARSRFGQPAQHSVTQQDRRADTDAPELPLSVRWNLTIVSYAPARCERESGIFSQTTHLPVWAREVAAYA